MEKAATRDQSKTGEQLRNGPNAGGTQDKHMAVVLGIHLLDILQEVHAVFPSIIEPANERRDIDRFLCVLCRSVGRRRLLLAKTEGNVDADPCSPIALQHAKLHVCMGI